MSSGNLTLSEADWSDCGYVLPQKQGQSRTYIFRGFIIFMQKDSTDFDLYNCRMAVGEKS